MILGLTQNHIKVRIDGKTVTVMGEMFHPDQEKMGFAVDVGAIRHWDPPHAGISISPLEVLKILEEISADFAKGGHKLEIE